MLSFPILRHDNLSSVVAVDDVGSMTVGRFLADISALADQLPGARHVVNLCADRYRFTVGFLAALLRRQVTLLPSSEASSPLMKVAAAYPGAYFLCDGPAVPAGTGTIFQYPRNLPVQPVCAIPAIPADQQAAVLFTSGSTGTPMPHKRSWGAMVNSTRAAGRALGLPGYGQGYVLGTVPHQHSYGLESTVMLSLQHGLAFHRIRMLLPGDIVAQLESMATPRILVTTPIHLRSLVGHETKLPQVECIICATAPLATDLARMAEKRFASRLYEIYGCTEIGQMAIRRTVDTLEWDCIDGIELRDRDGDIVASGNAAATEGPVNDLVELINSKRFILKDRKSDVVNVAGKRSSLAYLNHHLNAIDGVRDGIFVVPQHSRGPIARLAAYVVAPGLSSSQILADLRLHLDPAFLPRPIHFVDALPRNSMGKLTREAVEDLSNRRSSDGWTSVEHRFESDHATSAGHFPGNPIIPGALLLDLMLRVIDQSQVFALPREIRVAKFLRPVRPGDKITLRWRHTETCEIAFECRLAGSNEIVLVGAAVEPR